MTKIVFENWGSFVKWAKENGYDESYFNVNDSKCLALYETFLQECWEAEVLDPNQ
jgi:hypothetical protein